MTDGWMDTTQAAQYADMNPRVLARLARKKKIRGEGVGSDGRHWKFKAFAIDRWLIAQGKIQGGR